MIARGSEREVDGSFTVERQVAIVDFQDEDGHGGAIEATALISVLIGKVPTRLAPECG